jgi:competence protein ComEC
MNLLKFIPIKLTFFLVLGILLGDYLDLSIPISGGITLLAILFMGFLFYKNKNSTSFGLMALLATTCIGVFAISLWKPKNQSNYYGHIDVKDTPVLKLKIREVLKSNRYSDRYIALVKSVNKQPTSGKILLSISSDSLQPRLHIDQELMVYDKLSKVKKPLNQHQFNFKDYLEKIEIYDQLYLDQTRFAPLKNSSTSIYGFAAKQRSKIIAKLQKARFGKDELSVIKALLLGDRNDISENTYDNYKNAGAVHILALSGLHIGILLLLLQFLLQPLEKLPKGRTLKLITIVILLWCFALLAGFSASIIRAVTMFSFVAYALYLNRPSNTFNILALSMFFILLIINPMLLFQVGFQMSYAAVFAIVWLYPLLQKLWFPKNIIIKKIWQLLSVSIAAQLGVLPISLFYFHQFPGLFFVSNLLIVPFLGIILGAGILVICLALFNILPDFIVSFYNSLIGLMNSIIAWVGQQETFLFKNISFDAPQLLLSYLVIIGLVISGTKTTYKRLSFLLISILGLQIWSLYTSYESTKKESLFIPHLSKTTTIANRKGKYLEVITNSRTVENYLEKDYLIAERIENITIKPLYNSYSFQKEKILVVDSSGVYPTQKSHYVLLTQSPKLNLDRLIDTTSPSVIIADGSNYHSYINRWKTTCKKRNLPFHYTGEKGSFYFE